MIKNNAGTYITRALDKDCKNNLNRFYLFYFFSKSYVWLLVKHRISWI